MDFISYYNNQLQIKESFIYRSVMYGCKYRDGRIIKGILELTREHLINQGLWEFYLGFNNIFIKISQALNNVSRRIAPYYGKRQ